MPNKRLFLWYKEKIQVKFFIFKYLIQNHLNKYIVNKTFKKKKKRLKYCICP